MKTIKSSLLTIGVVLLLSSVPVMAQRGRTIDPQLAKKVRHELVTLPYYGVFDNLAYRINGNTVTLYGEVVRSSTRSDAGNRVKRLAGVSRVVNNIRVLPLSRFDDDIRVATYRSIARMGGLGRYLRGANPSVHIVVNNGHVTLEGVVSNNSDKALANMAARQVSGVFSVTNNLQTDRESGIG